MARTTEQGKHRFNNIIKPMDKFRIFKIVLSPASSMEGDWTNNTQVEWPDLSKAQERFESLFRNGAKQLPIGKDGLTGDDPLPNRILANYKGVTLLRLNHPKGVTVWKPSGNDYDKKTEDSFPYCYIVIDNRPGVGQLAIEVKSDAWNDPEKVKDILEANLNRMLRDISSGFVVEFRHKWLPSDFFEYVKQRKKDDNVIISHLYYEFTNPRFETPIETAVETSGHLRQLMNMLTQLGGAKAKLAIDAPKNDSLIRRKMKDIKQMVSLVASNGYKLKVKFSDNSEYECNEYLVADIDLHLNIIRDFEHGVMHNLFEFEIFHWLDEVRNKTKIYKDEETPRRKPARKNRRKIS